MTKQEGTRTQPGIREVTAADSGGFAQEKKFQEIFLKANTTRNSLCPVRDIITNISDKWSFLVLYALGGFGTLRFNEIKHKIGDISQRMLTVTLRNLERNGLVTRTQYAEVPPRVEYTLTPLGFALMHQLAQLALWAEGNSKKFSEARKRYGS